MRAGKAALAAGFVALSLAGAAAAHETAALITSPLELQGGEFSGASLSGAWRLQSPEPAFGGISGLLVEGPEVTAITDEGRWIEARRGADALRSEIAIAPMRRPDGRTFGKSGGDAEGLARQDGRLVVSFERDHRIARLGEDGRMTEIVQTRAMERLPSNGGMEALATLPDGRLLAIAEEPADGGFPMFIVDRDGEVAESRLPRVSRHKPTGADVGPDGRLYVVHRHFSILTGFSIRVRRYHLGDDGLPVPDTLETLAAWESLSGIDNMEGIAAFRDAPDGPVKLWLISDDNFNAIQRTILVELEVR